MRGDADALERGGADCVHAHDRNCGGNQSGRKDDDDLAHLALLSEMMLAVLVVTNEHFIVAPAVSAGAASVARSSTTTYRSAPSCFARSITLSATASASCRPAMMSLR